MTYICRMIGAVSRIILLNGTKIIREKRPALLQARRFYARWWNGCGELIQALWGCTIRPLETDTLTQSSSVIDAIQSGVVYWLWRSSAKGGEGFCEAISVSHPMLMQHTFTLFARLLYKTLICFHILILSMNLHIQSVFDLQIVFFSSFFYNSTYHSKY